MWIDFFENNSLFDATSRLFHELGIRLNSNTSEPLDHEAVLKQYAKDTPAFQAIERTYFSGLIDDSVFAQLSFFKTGYNFSEALAEVDKTYEGLMLFSLELSKKPTRTEISELTRAFNRISQKMPVALLLKYSFDGDPHISIAISERFKYQQTWRQGEKTGKIIILRDINTKDPHSGHLRILKDLVKPVGVTTFAQLHQQWLDVLDVSVLNKRFFNDLANWYLYSQDFVKFPNDLKVEEEKHIQINLIRLITRLIFVWFLKEKGLVQEALFEPSLIKKWLKSFDPNGETSKSYYPAILQNLFFATLNQRMKERDFIVEGSFAENKEQYGVKTLYRYASMFKISEDEVKALFQDIPFLNGGLFDCLDKEDEETKKVVYVDGFSRNARKVPTVPDFLFFGDECTIDLTEKYGYRKNKEKFCGIIEIFKSYKFTIEENTPIEEEIALDPELLGKVFENLLAYYNPETETTARKQTGSFYTPREIVNYMVDESLVAYLKKEMLTVSPAYLEFGKTQTQLFANEARRGQLSFVENLNHNRWQERQDELESELRHLVHYNTDRHRFTEEEVQQLIFAIDHCKILDPACGSGAFPMGILHKLVYILSKLDPENRRWRELQQKKAEIEIHKALSEKDKAQREKKLVEINDAFEHNSSDYGRKLYLIENCIYGVDIQAIAVQISKLRFFISLIVDQKERKNAENRGIRPLPNLETKFVAANTLIGLEKPKQLGLVPTELEDLEKKLEQIRHRHFEAKTRKEKLQCQKEDKAIRKKIAELLKRTGWHKEDADKIAGFDIYDQNLSAEWFDPVWMFGKDVAKFHIIIGNPPWGARLTIEEKNLFKKTYKEIDSSTPNSFAYFIGWSLKNYSCFISLVLPDSILIKDYEKTRGLISEEMSEIVWYENSGLPEEYKPFVYVDHDVCVLNINKGKSTRFTYKLIRYDRHIKSLVEQIYNQEKSTIILKEFNNVFNLIAQANDFKILEAIKRFDLLDEFLQCHEGIHSGNARDILFIRSKKNKFCHPLFYGGGAGDKIDNYFSCTSGWYVDYREDIIDKKNGYYASLRDERIFKYPKIYLTRTGNPFKAFLDEGENYASNNFFSLQFKDYDKNDSRELKYILPFVISKVAQYFIRTFAAPRLGSTFVETKIFHLLKFRVPKQHKAKKTLVGLVEIIIFLKQRDENTALFERLIDAVIYEVYFPNILQNAGCEFLSFLQDIPMLSDSYSEDKNEKLIKEFSKKISSPNNPLSSALHKLININEVELIEGRK